jgi:hypothetical protein
MLATFGDHTEARSATVEYKPGKRLVALMDVKAEMDNKRVLARFEAERQAMIHPPNIPRGTAAGTTEAGRRIGG